MGGRKMNLFDQQEVIKCTLWPASRKKAFWPDFNSKVEFYNLLLRL